MHKHGQHPTINNVGYIQWCYSHRIVSMHQLGQMLWPVHLLVFTQFPYHVHQHLVSPFHLSIGLSMVRQSPNLLYAYKLTKLSDDVSFKIGPSIAQELGWCYKDQGIALPQKLSNSFHSLIRGHIHHVMLCKMVTKDEKVHHVWQLNQLQHCSIAGKVIMQKHERCGNNDGSHWGFVMNALMLQALLTVIDCPLHLSGHARLPELVIQQVQCLLLTLVSSITMTSIHGSYPVSLWDHKSNCKASSSSPAGGGDCKELPSRALISPLLENSLTLFSICIVSQQDKDPLDCCPECWILLLSSHQVSHM